MINLTKKEAARIAEILSGTGDKDDAALARRVERSAHTPKPRSAKNKGLGWQKDVCAFVSRLLGVPYDQRDDDCEIHSRESGLNGTDVVLRGSAKRRFPFCIECKASRTVHLPEWVRQAESNCDDKDNWLLFVKSPLLPHSRVVVMDMDRFGRLVAPLYRE